MKTLGRVVVIAVIVIAAAAGGVWYGQHHPREAVSEGDTAHGDASEDVKPVAEVAVAPIRRGSIRETITAYGSVVAPPGDVRIVSVPFEARVARLFVTAGQEVTLGMELVHLAPSPDALLALQEAKNALAAAERDLKQVRQRFESRLATNAEVSTAEQALESAKLKLSSLTERGAGTEQTLKADAAGIISKVDVQEGQIVPAGGPLVEIVSGKRVGVSLAVEPADAEYLKPRQPVQLKAVDHPTTRPVRGEVLVVGRRVDPATRLVGVQVSLPQGTGWMLDTFVAAEITKEGANGLIVPRDAVLPEEGGESVLYTVAGDHAVKHAVHVGLDDGREVQVIAEDVKEGEMVVVSGNYELEDGMMVTPHSAAASTMPATTAPSAAAGGAGEQKP